MACSYDTQTVLEMLFDIATDNGIYRIEYATTQITIVVVVIVARTKCATITTIFNIRKVR